MVMMLTVLIFTPSFFALCSTAGRQHRQRERNLQVWIGLLESDEGLIAQRDRVLIFNRHAFDVEIDGIDVIAVDHGLIFGLQGRRVRRRQRGFLSGGTAERDRDVAAGGLDPLHLLEDRGAVDERVIGDGSDALPTDAFVGGEHEREREVLNARSVRNGEQIGVLRHRHVDIGREFVRGICTARTAAPEPPVVGAAAVCTEIGLAWAEDPSASIAATEN
jgi:hypothetical protein